MARSAPIFTDTVIVGNGPSALILSYILHGNVPRYVASPPHPDPLLHAKLIHHPDLLHLNVRRVTEHFEASQLSYPSQALPVNVLLDALVRPHGDASGPDQAPALVWTSQPARAVSHLVIGNTAVPGGQWVENPVHASWNIGALSYAGMLSLPGYSFAEYYFETTGKTLLPFVRPSRQQVTEYFQHYPHRMRLNDAIWCQQTVSGVTRTPDGFYITSHGLSCRHLVLASGVFSELIPPPPLLHPLVHLPGPSDLHRSTDGSLLVVGSGFSAADIIASCPPEQHIIHIYQWKPSSSPSPLRACHQQAYPEYAGVYRRMKQAARKMTDIDRHRPGLKAPRRSATSGFDLSRDWDSTYEGLPNTAVTAVTVEGETAQLTLKQANGQVIHRRIRHLEYVVGRRGSLKYLSLGLRREIHPDLVASDEVSGQTLREKVLDDVEVAPAVFAIGSLTGDSLIRFAFGSAVYAAGSIMARRSSDQVLAHHLPHPQLVHDGSPPPAADVSEGRDPSFLGHAPKIMNGVDGH